MALRFLGQRALAISVGTPQVQGSGLLLFLTVGMFLPSETPFHPLIYVR